MNSYNNTTEKILSAIETKHVKPIPKWYFVLRNSILWIPGLVTTILGAYTFAGIIYGVLHNPWIELGPAPARPVVYAAGVPVLWVLSFLLFSAVTLSLVRRAHIAYRHTVLQILLVSVAASIIIGILFYALTQDSLDNHLNTYYRYPTQFQRQYFFERNAFQERMN